MTPEKNHHEHDDLPELPPLEDDGSLFEGDDEQLIVEPVDGGLDDSTSEDDAHDRFGALGVSTAEHEGSLLDGAEGNDELVVTDARDLLAGAEVGLLEDSDEGDGREMSADEAGVHDSEQHTEDDGGVEGTGEDPSAALEAVPGELHVADATDDEGFDDDTRFEDAGAARARQGLEREPWPRRSDAAWIISRCDDDVSATSSRMGVADVVADTRDGALVVSLDGGLTFRRVAGCSHVTAIAVLRATRQVVAALHDSTRDASAVVLVRTTEGEPIEASGASALTAELIGDLMADEADEDVRITSLHVRSSGRSLEVIARGAFGAVSLRPRPRG